LFLVRPRPLSFEVANLGPGQVGAWISAPAVPLPLSFSDGTVLTLAPEARARIVAVERSGARLVLEQGTLAAHVVHREDTHWSVVAGPFEVRVTGTRFDVVWSRASDVFELRLKEGAVTVTGPSLGTGRQLRAGENLRVDVSEPKTAQRASGQHDSQAPAAAPQLPEPGAKLSAAPPAVVSSSRNASPALPPPPPSTPPASDARAARQSVLKALRASAAAGDYPEVVRVAQANDFSALCREASIDDLMLLADAARLSGAFEPARDALLSLRDRFSADPRAATAAFLLGRIFFEQLKAYPRAAHWFTVYLDEQPNGELADDALSRLAEAKALSGDQAGARQAARRYLERNPQGPQAERAKLLAH
jgi:transmembrane sensor